jgi:hypothetical protein
MVDPKHPVVMRVLVGMHGTDPNSDGNVFATVELPPGYRRVWQGAIKPGDLYLNCTLILKGQTRWERAPYQDTGTPGSAESYACLIRPERGLGPDHECERCGVFQSVDGERFCEVCRKILLGSRKR